MNFTLKRLFLLIIITFSILTSVYSANANPVCCYVGDSIRTDFSGSSSCEAKGGIDLGGIRQGTCDYLESDRVSCKYYTAQNTCTNTLGAGYAIYDIPEVIDFIESETNRNINELCAGGLVPYDSTCASTSNENPSTGNPGSSNGGGSGSPDTDNPLDPNDLPDGESGVDYEVLSNTCESTGGGFLGFFAKKSVCESVVFNNQVGGNPCIYNPYGGGLFSSQLHYDYPSSLNEFEEPACVAKLEISACSDYKTQNNCESNSAYGQDTFSSKSPLLEQGCTWIPSEDYASSLQNQATGMCVSKAVENNVDYNIRNYNKRKNILENPSFRNGLENWTTSAQLSQTAADSDFAAVELNSGEILEQIITQINYGETYTPKLFVKFLSSPEFPRVVVEELVGGTVTQTYELTPVIRPQLETDTIFEEVIYSGISISNQAESIRFKIISKGNSVIDLVSLESPLENTISSASNQGIFIPTQMVPKDASYCSSCYVKDGINTCTQEKSDSLGACSYMVSGPQDPYQTALPEYTGKDENVYTQLGTLLPWKSQSIANSELFCEMYLTQNSCLDPQNHVNSHYGELHMYSSSTICKWDSSIGCFKDSNDDSIPDVKKGTIYSKNMSSTEMVNFYSPLTNYNFEGQNSLPSDFASACDVIPPVVYSYLVAKNSSGQFITLEGTSSDQLLGEASLIVQVMDYFPDEYGCENYPLVEQQSYVVINSSVGAPKFEVNSFSTNTYNLKELYGGSNLDVEEKISFGIEVFDQSGNYGLQKSVELTGLDLFSPEIRPFFDVEVLNSAEDFSGSSSKDINFVTSNYVSKNSELNFSVFDGGGITSCSYILKGLDGISGNFGETNIVEPTSQNEMNLSINLSSYQYDVELVGGTLQLNVECGDIFGQNTSQIYLLKHLGELYIDSPKPFPQDIRDYNISLMEMDTQGFYNQKNQTFEAYLTRDDLTSCSLGEYDLEIISGTYEGFEGVDATFSTLITGEFSFSEGTSEQNFSLSCQTSSSNALEASLYYFYEEETPNLLGYSLPSDSNSTLYFNETWYTINPPSQTDIFLDLDGTQSWIQNSYQMYLNDELVTTDSQNFDVIEYAPYTNGHDFSSNALINGISYNTNLGATRSIGEMIQVYNWDLELVDKTGNKANHSITYHYDYSTPSISFGGDIITQQGTELFTSKKDPQIQVSFSTPMYRTFSCDIVIEQEDSSTIRRDLGNFPESSFSFKLSDYLPSVDVSQDNLELSLECVEETFTQEEPELSGVPFTFVFDDTRPILKNISLEGGSKRYFGNARGLEISSILDTLKFEFEDTGERSYTCEYKIVSPQENYYCDPQSQSRNFNDGSINQQVDVRLLTGFQPNDRLQSDSTFICSQRTQRFWNSYDQATHTQGTFSTSLEIVASCEDAAGFKTQQVSTGVDIVYSSSSIIDVEFSFEGGVAIPQVIMNSNDVSESLRYVFTSPDGGVVFDSLADSISQENGVSIVEFDTGIQTNQFLEEEVDLTLDVYSSQNVLDSIVVPLLLDFSAPSANLEVLDNFNGSVDSREFKVGIKAIDKGLSGVDIVEFYVNSQLVYSKQFGSYITSYEQSPPIVLQDSKTVFDLAYFFEGDVGETYDLELRVADGAGNYNSTNLSIFISNDVSFNLVDSQTVKLSRDPFVGLTRSTGDGETLEVKGEISPDATCSIYPFKENDLGVTDKGVFDSASFGESFSFDLSQDFIGFSMENAQDNSVILYFECRDSSDSLYQFRRELVRVVGLPDYTLKSSNGFYFNSKNADDYISNLQIESVGPYKEISCQYSFQGTSYQTASGIGFVEQLPIDPQSGSSDLTLTCEDIFGVNGPQKSYEFVVLDDAPVQIGAVNVISDLSTQNVQDSSQDIIYVSPQTNYVAEFELNKKGVSCSLNIIKSGSFTNRVVGFFDNLFNLGSISIEESDSAYIYRSLEPLSFESDSTLKISCESGVAEKEFDVKYLETQDYEISLS